MKFVLSQQLSSVPVSGLSHAKVSGSTIASAQELTNTAHSQYSEAILDFIVLCDVVKLFCMLVTLLRSLRHSVIVEYAPLTTIADTIASFLALPDPTSTDRCLLEQDIVRKIPNKLRKPWLRNTNFDWHVNEYLAGLTVHGTCKQCGSEYVGNHDWHYDPEDGGFLCSNCHEGYVCKRCAEKNPKPV